MTDQKEELTRFGDRPEDLVYRSCYAPVDLRSMLADAENRAKIRRLPVSQIFFGLKELDDSEIERLLPHITEEQWLGILDLDLWHRDRLQTGSFLGWQKYWLKAQDAVARKLLRGTDTEMWELTFSRELRVHRKLEEDEFEGEPGEDDEWMVTPDGHYLVILPENAEKAALLRLVLLQLYRLEPGWAALLLESSLFRAASDVEETAYQNRTGRLEELGFQDYFEAIEVYSPLLPGEKLPEKRWERPMEMNILPARLPQDEGKDFLLFQAFDTLSRAQEIQSLVEELFYVCNKVLSADQVSPASPEDLKRAIRKTLAGINLGLDSWAGGDLGRAAEGIQSHYLQSFFQLAYGQLLELQKEADRLSREMPPQAGGFEEAVLEGFRRRYPVLTSLKEGRIRRRFLRNRRDLAQAKTRLGRMARA